MGARKVFLVIVADDECIYLYIPVQSDRLAINPVVDGIFRRIFFDQTAGTNNRVAQNSAIKRSGWAWINDISISAQNRQNSQLTVQFTGTGPLS